MNRHLSDFGIKVRWAVGTWMARACRAQHMPDLQRAVLPGCLRVEAQETVPGAGGAGSRRERRHCSAPIARIEATGRSPQTAAGFEFSDNDGGHAPLARDFAA